MTRIARFFPSRLCTMLIVATSTTAAFAASGAPQPQAPAAKSSVVIDSAAKNAVIDQPQTLVAGPGAPAPIPTTKGGGSFVSGLSLS